MFLLHPLVKIHYRGDPPRSSDLRRQDLNLEPCVWRAASSDSPQHLQEVLMLRRTSISKQISADRYRLIFIDIKKSHY